MDFELIVTRYVDHAAALYHVRHAVFVEEQKVPVELELDERDSHCVHVLVTQAGDPVATGRIDLDDGGRIGRLAVLSEQRKFGLGRKVMQALENVGRDAGLKRIWFHAQNSAIGFYEKLGYHVIGEEFLEAGIKHKSMEKLL